MHFGYNYWMRGREANLPKPPSNGGFSGGTSSETHAVIQQTSCPSDFSSFQKRAPEPVLRSFEKPPPEYDSRSSASCNYQNSCGVSMQHKDHWQSFGPRYMNNRGLVRNQSFISYEAPPLTNQNPSPQLGRIRVRDVNSLNNIVQCSQPVSADLQKHLMHVNRCNTRQDILGHNLNPINNPSSRFDGNRFRPPVQKPPAGPRLFTCQNRYAKTREQGLRYAPYHVRNTRASEHSCEINSASLLQDLMSFLKPGKRVSQTVHEMDRSSNVSTTTTKGQILKLSELLECDHDSHQSPNRSQSALSKSSEVSNIYPVNQESSSRSIESVMSPVVENVSECVDSSIKVRDVVSLPEWCDKRVIGIQSVPTNENYNLISSTVKMVNEDFLTSVPSGVISNDEPKDPSNVKNETKCEKPEEEDSVIEIELYPVKTEVFQEQDDDEPEIISIENSPKLEKFDVENENETEEKKMSQVDENELNKPTVRVEESNARNEDPPDIQEIKIEIPDSTFKSTINRDKLDRLIEFLKRSNDDDGQNHSTKPSDNEGESVKPKMEKSKSSAKEVFNNVAKIDTARRSVEESETSRTDDSEEKTKPKKNDQNSVLRNQPKDVENEEESGEKGGLGDREKSQQGKKASKTPGTKKGNLAGKGKTSEANKEKLDADVTSEKPPESENSVQGVSDNQEKSRPGQTQDSPEPGPSTRSTRPEEIKFPLYFDSKYKFCENCLTARAMPEFWMNIATGELSCVYCLNGTSRYAELQRQKLKTLEARKSRCSTESIYSSGNVSNSLCAQEKIPKESSDDKNYLTQDNTGKELNKREKRKSLDENALYKSAKKRILDKSSNQKTQEQTSRTPGGAECSRTVKPIRISLIEINKKSEERARKYSSSQGRKSKDEDPPYAQKRANSTEDIWSSKRQILEKVDCTDKHKKSLEILESMQQLEKAEFLRNEGNKEKRQGDDNRVKNSREISNEKQDPKKHEVKKRVLRKDEEEEEEEEEERRRSIKKPVYMMKQSPVASSPGLSPFDFSFPDPPAKDMDFIKEKTTKRRRKYKER